MKKELKIISIASGICIFIAVFTGLLLLFERTQEIPISKETNNYLPQSQYVELGEKNPIKVGVLHSLSGTMAISERPVVDATLMAIDEVNQKGGVLGRKIVPIVADGRSDWPTFAKEAERLITEENVSAIFGGWTSASRKTMKPVFEKYDSLLFYPVQYEGLEQSPNIIYTGAAPNQQVLPAIDWAMKNIGTKFFLVGSDYVFPRSANTIMKERINELGGVVVGEEYRVLGEKDFTEIIDKIIESHPDVILNTINGDSNVWFFQGLSENGITSQDIPTISFSIGENEIMLLGAENMKGNYAAWNYFQSLDIPENKNFVTNFKQRFGDNRVTNDPMEAAYVGVNLFAHAVEKSGSDRADDIRKNVMGMTFAAPEGIVGVDPQTQHLKKVVRIGKILGNGQFEIVASSEQAIKAIPYPQYKSVNDWNLFLDTLYNDWNQSWSKPTK